MELLTEVLLLASLVLDTVNFGFDLLNLIFLLSNEFLDSLKSLVTLLHTEKRLLPIFKKSLLTHDDTLDFDCCLL